MPNKYQTINHLAKQAGLHLLEGTKAYTAVSQNRGQRLQVQLPRSVSDQRPGA